LLTHNSIKKFKRRCIFYFLYNRFIGAVIFFKCLYLKENKIKERKKTKTHKERLASYEGFDG